MPQKTAIALESFFFNTQYFFEKKLFDTRRKTTQHIP